jgi:hypothetical protein
MTEVGVELMLRGKRAGKRILAFRVEVGVSLQRHFTLSIAQTPRRLQHVNISTIDITLGILW